jgi:hypothetical protein
LSDDGSALQMKFDSPPFSITVGTNLCDFIDYEGSFKDTLMGSGSQELAIERLLPLMRHQLRQR